MERAELPTPVVLPNKEHVRSAGDIADEIAMNVLLRTQRNASLGELGKRFPQME